MFILQLKYRPKILLNKWPQNITQRAKCLFIAFLLLLLLLLLLMLLHEGLELRLALVELVCGGRDHLGGGRGEESDREAAGLAAVAVVAAVRDDGNVSVRRRRRRLRSDFHVRLLFLG